MFKVHHPIIKIKRMIPWNCILSTVQYDENHFDKP